MTELGNADDLAQSDSPGSGTTSNRRSGKGSDLNRKLLIVVLGMIILWLSGIAFALVFGMLTSKAPRTSVERSLRVYEAAVSKGSTDPAIWSDYIGALIEAQQYTKAERAIGDALERTEEQHSRILVQSAKLALARKDYPAAVKAGDLTLVECAAEVKATEERYKKSGITAAVERPSAYGPALVIKADALTQLGKKREAVAAYDVFLEQIPRASDVLVLRGNLKAALNDKEGAEADYQQALKYIPDYETALEGLTKIGVEAR